MEASLPVADLHPGRCWNARDIASIPVVDTARRGLLLVRVWRFRRPEIPAAGSRPARLPGGCLAPLRCLSQPTQCSTLRSGQGDAAPPLNPQLLAPHEGDHRTVTVASPVTSLEQ